MRAYTAAAIPNESGEWFVYLTPSADAANVWPLGDDVRYRISGDGLRVLETRRMHAGMVDASRSTSTDGTRLLTSKGGKSLHELPEDSDVFHVLMGRPVVPEIVVTPHHQFVIGLDGRPQLDALRETVRRSDVRAIIAQAPDRLARDRGATALLVAEFGEGGAAVLTVEGPGVPLGEVCAALQPHQADRR